MKILIAAGGTAGHINPALAIADELKRREPQAEILFVGRKGGMEYTLVTEAGYPFIPMEVHGFQRKINIENIGRNIVAAWHLLWSLPHSRKIISQFRPDICIGTGGYISGPIIRAAARAGIKTVIHEQNAFPGVTNKLLAKEVDLILCGTQGAAKQFALPAKTKVVGNPVRTAIFEQNAQEAKENLGANGRTVLLSFGGSLGAAPLNKAVVSLAQWHLKEQNFLHIHATGKAGKEDFMQQIAEKGIIQGGNFAVVEYIKDMPQALAAADLVISRAGALTLSEITAMGRASILVPSPYVAENHQFHNATELERVGAAIVVEEKNLNGELLIELVKNLTVAQNSLAEMGEKAKTLAKPNAAKEIVQQLFSLL